MTDKEQITAEYEAMYKAMIAKDTLALGRLLTDDSVLVHMTGLYGGGRHTWRLQMESRLRKENGVWRIAYSRASTY